MSAKTHTLLHPIERETGKDGETRTEELRPKGSMITVRRPKARDVKIAGKRAKDDIDLAILMIARLTDLDEDEAEHLDLEDFEALGELAMPSSAIGPKTGATA